MKCKHGHGGTCGRQARGLHAERWWTFGGRDGPQTLQLALWEFDQLVGMQVATAKFGGGGQFDISLAGFADDLSRVCAGGGARNIHVGGKGIAGSI